MLAYSGRGGTSSMEQCLISKLSHFSEQNIPFFLMKCCTLSLY